MYESFFELRVKPFELLPDPRFIYLSNSHKKALTYLDYGIREKAGFILLTGEVGSGKTTLMRELLNKQSQNAVVSRIFNTRINSEQLLAMISDDFGLPTQGKDKISLIRDLNEFLIEQYACGNQAILIIDEAQNLAPEMLEEVRMLSNLESADHKLLQIILVGQPELKNLLGTPELRQLRQRISINSHLQALSREETEHYILHRLEVAGNVSAVDFSPESLEAVFIYSRGIPRLINIICDFLMLAAFAEETKYISSEMVREVIGDLDFNNNFWGDPAITKHPTKDVGSNFDSPSLSYDLHERLNNIFERLDLMDSSLNTRVKAALAEFKKRIDDIEDSFKTHVAAIDTRISNMHSGLEEVKLKTGEESFEMHTRPPGTSFIRRIFGNELNKKQI